MKKILFLILTVSISLFLFSCSETEYEPVESTEEESRVVMTLEIDGEEYEVKYELYRMLFLNNKSTVDGGDDAVWSSDSKDEYIEEINKIIIKCAADIYSALHLANEIGYDVYSEDADALVEEYIRLSVEGNDADITGHGSYEQYLASLSERNMNYAVADLIFRYSLALDAIDEYYIGTTDDVLGQLPGEFEVTESAVREYYFGEESARVLHLYFSEDARDVSQMYTYRDIMESKSSELDVALYIINTGSPIVPEELIDTATRTVSGIMVGKYSFDEAYYSEYTETVFELDENRVSDVITVTDGETGYYIIYKLEKSENHFTKRYDDIKNSYLSNEIGKVLYGIRADLSDSAEYTDTYSEINHSSISMN